MDLKNSMQKLKTLDEKEHSDGCDSLNKVNRSNSSRLIRKLQKENDELRIELIRNKTCYNSLNSDLKEIAIAEEKMNLEMAFLGDEKDHFENELKETRRLLLHVQNDYKDLLEKHDELKKRYSELCEIKEQENLEQMDQIANLLEAKRKLMSVIASKIPDTNQKLLDSMIETDEIVQMKSENNFLKRELKKFCFKNLLQEQQIYDMNEMIKHMTRLVCVTSVDLKNSNNDNNNYLSDGDCNERENNNISATDFIDEIIHKESSDTNNHDDNE